MRRLSIVTPAIGAGSVKSRRGLGSVRGAVSLPRVLAPDDRGGGRLLTKPRSLTAQRLVRAATELGDVLGDDLGGGAVEPHLAFGDLAQRVHGGLVLRVHEGG